MGIGVGEGDLPKRMRLSVVAAAVEDGCCCCRAALSRWLMAATDDDKLDLGLMSSSVMFICGGMDQRIESMSLSVDVLTLTHR